jgi:hypothetical protein
MVDTFVLPVIGANGVSWGWAGKRALPGREQRRGRGLRDRRACPRSQGPAPDDGAGEALGGAGR